MNDAEHLLISLEERHALNIFAGTKQVELRRRAMHIDPGAKVWIYVKQPVGSVLGHVTVSATQSMSPALLWRRFGTCSGLEEVEFFRYFEGVTAGFALELISARMLSSPVSLEALRGAARGFHPPQFFSRVDPAGALFKVLSSVTMDPARPRKASKRTTNVAYA
ncbi:MAG: transcriptional regulator [Burkholderiales bacterium]